MDGGPRAAIACVLCALLLAAACGGTDEAVPRGSDTVTLYSSLPLQGPGSAGARDMVDSIKLALQRAGGKVGPFSVTYVSLDSATREEGTWSSDRVLDNARQAVRDINAIGYIGERDSAATALSLPLTNEGHILQVSPSSTYDGLTRSGRRQGEPQRFYPSGKRTFGRVVPPDRVQASALMEYMRAEGARTLALLASRDLYGSGLAEQVERAGARRGIAVEDLGRIDASSGDLSGAARRVAAAGADAFLFAGAPADGAARILTAVAAADRDVRLFGAAPLADAAFARRLREPVRRRLRVTTPVLPWELLPPRARAFRARFRATFGRAPAPEALQAHAAAEAILHAIGAAGVRGNDRDAVREAFFAVDGLASVLGTFSIDPHGDPTLRRYAGNRVGRGGPVFERVLAVGG